MTVRIAIIGAGWWAAENHLPLLKQAPDVDVVGVCGIDQGSLRRVQTKFRIPFATEDFRELLDRLPLDGVVVSSPHNLHFEHARSAVERGAHVLVEKPFTTNSREARVLVELARRQGVQIVVPFGWNFSPVAEAARGLLGQSSIGRLSHGVLHMASPTEDLFMARQLRFTRNSLVQPTASTWADPAGGGGFGWGQLSHALGFLFLIVEEVPVSVYARCRLGDNGVDLSDALIVEFDSGATVVVSGSSGLPSGSKNHLDLRVFGEQGAMVVDFDREYVALLSREGVTQRATVPLDSGRYECTRPVDLFLDLCRGKEERFNPGSGAIGCRATEVLDAMYRSIRSGRAESV